MLKIVNQRLKGNKKTFQYSRKYLSSYFKRNQSKKTQSLIINISESNNTLSKCIRTNNQISQLIETSHLSIEKMNNTLKFNFSTSLVKDSTSLQPNKQRTQILQIIPESSKMLFFSTDQLQSILNTGKARNKFILNQQNTKTTSTNQKQFFHLNQNQPNQFNSILKQITNICKSNPYLSNGKLNDYKDFPLSKLIEISLKFIEQHYTTAHSILYGEQGPKTHWKNIQYNLRGRLHNCALKDYLRILFIVLQTYNSVYNFNSAFIESLISGIRKQVPLMEEIQLMQLFFIISQNNRLGRTKWQNNLKYSKVNSYEKQRIRSPFFQHQFLTTLHDQFLQKMVRKYKKKYIETSLTFKEQDFIKICVWVQMTMALYNKKISKIDKEQNNKKHTYILGFVQVLSKGFLRNMTKMKPQKNQVVNLIQKKSFQIKSFGELKELISALSLIKSYIQQESQSYRLSQVSQSEVSEIELKEGFDEGSILLNATIQKILSFQNVKLCIDKEKQSIFPSEQTEGKTQNINQKGQIVNENIDNSKQCNHEQNKISNNEIIGRSTRFFNFLKQINTIDKGLIERVKIISHIKIIKLLIKSNMRIHYTLFDQNQKKGIQLNKNQQQKLVQLCSSQIDLLYNIVQDHYMNPKILQKELNSVIGLQRWGKSAIDNYNDSEHGINMKKSFQNLNLVYGHIIETCFYYYLNYGQQQGEQEAFINAKEDIDNEDKNNNKEDKNSHKDIKLFQVLFPQTIKKMMNLQMLLNKQTHQQKNIRTYYGLKLLIKYTEHLLGLNENNKYYIRGLEFSLYSYFKQIQNLISQQETDLNAKIQAIIQNIKMRNVQAKQYLEQHNILYDQLINQKTNTYSSTFLNKNISLPGNNQKHLIQKNIKQAQFKFIQGEASGYNKTSMMLGQYIMKCIEKERKINLQNEGIIKLTKFFTQIKAFQQIKFSYPLTQFLVCPQFVYMPRQNKNIPQDKQNTSIIQQPLVLMFVSSKGMKNIQTQCIKMSYQINNLSVQMIDMDYFLSLHTNQRIQTLIQIIMKAKTTQKENALKIIQKTITDGKINQLVI